jgi:hypothetical protein
MELGTRFLFFRFFFPVRRDAAASRVMLPPRRRRIMANTSLLSELQKILEEGRENKRGSDPVGRFLLWAGLI